MKYFIITIDTEGDNLWAWKEGDRIETENAKYLQRFQNLCDIYDFKPVWLTNYEMISDPVYVDFISNVEASGTGELGMHLHAWNTPPVYALDVKKTGAPYLIEYPVTIMEEKIAIMTEILQERTGVRPVSHRAGRWATNKVYFELLQKYGYLVDCSVTPHEDWTGHAGATSGSAGSNYKNSPGNAYWLDENKTLLEVPLTIYKTRKYFAPDGLTPRKIAGSIKRSVLGNTIWLRPGHNGEQQMNYLIKRTTARGDDYLMFMLHSSEFMPGGSPRFKTQESIEDLFNIIQRLFEKISIEFSGITLRDYYKIKRNLL